MSENTEMHHSPDLDQKEKWQSVIRLWPLLIPLAFSLLYWFTPWIHTLLVSSSCTGFNDIKVVGIIVYAVFVGLPLLAGFILFLIMGRRLMASLNPAFNSSADIEENKKDNKIHAYVIIGIIAATVLVAIQGLFWSNELIYLFQYSSIPACN